MTDTDRLDALLHAHAMELAAARLSRFADRIYAGHSPGEAAGIEWDDVAVDIRRLVAAVRERDELREAAGAFLDEFEAAAAGDIPLDGHYQRQALARLRAALHREDGT